MTFKEPMLAASLLDPEVEHNDDTVLAAMKELRYPVLATLKIDGIRALRLNGTLLSRRFKPIPNKLIAASAGILRAGFDMELYNPTLDYNTIQSIVMSHVHKDWQKIQFHILDCFVPELPLLSYAERCQTILDWFVQAEPVNTHFNKPVWCASPEELAAFEKLCVANVGEGICFRTPQSRYKMGRSTLSEQFLVKVSRFTRFECIVIGFIEQQENTNRATRSATGKTERSHSVDGMVGKGTLGAFIVRNDKGQEFTVGTGVGLTNKVRQHIWNNQERFLGQTMTCKCKAHGQKVLPRSPIMVGWRNSIDL